jgi:hypothetical protein
MEKIWAYNPYTVYVNTLIMGPWDCASMYFDWTLLKGLTATLVGLTYYNQFSWNANIPMGI